MKSPSSPLALGSVAAAVWLLVILTTLSVCSSCATAPYVHRYTPAANESPRGREAQALYTVGIQALCVPEDPFLTGKFGFQPALGSGVLIDGTHVLTAWHVIDCEYLIDVHVKLSNGMRLKARIDVTWREHDLARLVLSDPIVVLPVRLAPPPSDGDLVCTARAFPQSGGECGAMLYTREVTAWGHGHWDMRFHVGVVPGNSGGGLYSASGELVGIVTARGLAVGNEGDGTGFATSLWQLRNKVMP